MTVETNPNYPSDLDQTLPLNGDGKTEGDDHLRNLKRVFKTTFPNVSGAVTPTHTVLNYMLGVTSAVQTQIDAANAARVTNDALKANLAGGATFTGTIVLPATTSIGSVSDTELGYVNGVTSAIQAQIDALDAAKSAVNSPTFTGIPAAPTATAGTSTTQLATTAFVTAAGLVSALPGQTGNSGKVVTTDGTNASWALVTTLGAEPTQTAASQAEMEAGAETAIRSMSPLRVSQAITALAPLVVPAATQAEQEAASSTSKYVTSGRQQFHPSAAKVWLNCGITGNIVSSYNVTSITDSGVGFVTVTIATDFSSANYVVLASVNGSDLTVNAAASAAGSMTAQSRNLAGASTDPGAWYLVAFGDQ